MTARESTFTPEIGAEICERIATGESLRAICRHEPFPTARTVHRWIEDDVQGFRQQYARARERQAEWLADELLDISDDGSNDWMEREGFTTLNGEHVQRSKLRVDTRKWVASKLLPKKYGDRVDLNHNGTITAVTRMEIVPVRPKHEE